MAPSAAYYEWLAAGEPYEPCRPVREFVDLLRAAGYTVYHKGDTPHMQAARPEDHTPFSATGWPVASKRWIGHALDIMPGGGPLDLVTLGARIINAKMSGVDGAQWIKYINWTDGAGATWHYAWESSFSRTTSTDKGHIHISARSDMDTSDVVSRSGYTPLGDSMALTQADINLLLASDTRPDDPAKNYAVGRALYDTVWIADEARDTIKEVKATVDAFSSKLDTVQPDHDVLASALVTALAAHPEIVDALATAVVAHLSMIPTAGEIAKAVGALDWHGSVTG